MEEKRIDPTQVKGWGVDADPENEPTWPIRKRVESEHSGYSWQRPPQQPVNIEVLHSNERPNVSATFGTSVPPHGLSGAIRRYAFRFSESSYGHWLPLMLADRVGMVEGILSDLGHARIPNIFGELGWAAEWKYNRKSLVTRVSIGALCIGAVAAYLHTAKSDED